MTRKSMGFRLSAVAVEHVRNLQRQTGLSQTAVVEMALALAVRHFERTLSPDDPAARDAVSKLTLPEPD